MPSSSSSSSLLAVLLLFHAARVAFAQPPPAPPAALLLHPLPLRSPFATCNDGSPATIYFRNCSANWDSKGPDYCANITNRWLIVFAGGDVRGALRGEPEGPAPS